MLPRNHPDRIQIAFDDHRLVANAGLILPATLALRLGLPQLLRRDLDLGGAPGRANTGDKMMTLVASAVKGGVKTYQRGVAVQDKCPFKWLAEMSLGYAAMVSDEDVVGPAQGRRVGGPSASRYFLTVALWIPNSRSIARSDIPLRLAF